MSSEERTTLEQRSKREKHMKRDSLNQTFFAFFLFYFESVIFSLHASGLFLSLLIFTSDSNYSHLCSSVYSKSLSPFVSGHSCMLLSVIVVSVKSCSVSPKAFVLKDLSWV